MSPELLDRWEMIPRGSRVLCAVSGGADSMCLMHWLWSLRTERGFEVLAAHFEHGLRGEESLRDAAFVKTQCDALQIPFEGGSGDVRSYASVHGMGIEEAARILRYRFLEETAERLRCERIATAHTADDNAETILLNLCRGAGTRGLAGIPPVRGKLIRPLLQTSREEVEAYLALEGIPHVEDSSNGDDAFTRNRIRHRVIPLLKEENPSFLRAAARTAEILREDDDCLNRMALAFLEEWEVPSEEGRSIPSKPFNALEPPVAARVVRQLCGSGVSLERTAAVLRFAKGTERGTLELPGRCVIRRKGRLYFPEKRN